MSIKCCFSGFGTNDLKCNISHVAFIIHINLPYQVRIFLIKSGFSLQNTYFYYKYTRIESKTMDYHVPSHLS